MFQQRHNTKLAVGLLSAKRVEIDFIKGFECEGLRLFNNTDFEPQLFEAQTPDARFEVKNVVIGIGFHWERRESQLFSGSVELKRDNDGNIVVINHVDVEEYIKSVISSEMSATSSLEFLKAHAVISRSWVMAQIAARDVGATNSSTADTSGDETEIVKWYDRENHTLFDVCADDHCQRYQGLERQVSTNVAEAVNATRGLVLTHNGALCDARFSKCCGGAMEEFQYCWDDVLKPYLVGKSDTVPSRQSPDLTIEHEARKWIEGNPEAFCNTRDRSILSQVLNSYDRETPDFFRWSVSYDARELGELIERKSGMSIGDIHEIEPLARGKSGRIYRLRITGSKRTVVVGKELEIRKWLSESHLYSSAFVVDKTVDTGGRRRFTLRGAGWGHGVGLCQIGAAVMSARGFDFRQILNHYYPGSRLTEVK